MAFMRVTKGVDEHPVLGLCQILGVPRLYLYIVDPMLGGGLYVQIFLGVRAFWAITATEIAFGWSYLVCDALNVIPRS